MSVKPKAYIRPSEIALVSALLTALVFKIYLMYPAATGHITLAVLQHDAGVFAILAGLYSVQQITKSMLPGLPRTTASWMLMLTILSVIAVYLFDVLAYYFFATRLYLQDIVTFSFEPKAIVSLSKSAYWIILKKPVWQLVLAALLIVGILASLRAELGKRYSAKIRSGIFAGLSFGLIVFFFVPFPLYVYSFGDKPLYENVFQRNVDFLNRATFSPNFEKELLAKTPVRPVADGRDLRLDVIVVLVESLSSYHSKFFSGVNDWTPNLDRIAASETSIPNFCANGWTTIGGLISVLTGAVPLVPETSQFNRWGSPRLTDFLGVHDPLPRILDGLGYTTAFVAAGNLTFLEQDKWLRAIGFQHLVGHDDPRYQGQKVRGPFDSVPDGLLYRVALQELAQMPADKPRFLTIQTFWSHRPFMSPDGEKLDGEEPVIRETDQQIGFLYESLRQIGFFEHGVLILTGDHRAMEPFRREEITKFGPTARMRIPAIVVTRAISLPSELPDWYQQRDIPSSIVALVSSQYRLRAFQGSFLSDPLQPSKCIIHARGDDRDLALVKCGDQLGTVRIDGDNTRFIDGSVPDAPSVIDEINLARIEPGRD